eukprot:9273626-Heterocapsa_arctica.AAC.1
MGSEGRDRAAAEGQGILQADRQHEELQGPWRRQVLGLSLDPIWVQHLSGRHLEGDITSNELDKGDDNYVLVSVRAQNTLGFVKDTVTGKCHLK